MRAGILLLAALFATSVAADQYQGLKWATVDISPEGRVTQVELADPLPEPMAVLMRQEIGTWAFTPAKVDDEAVPSRTHIAYTLRARALESGEYGVEIVDVRSGPRLRSQGGLHYPEQALRRGIQGTVYLALTIAPDGSVADVDSQERSDVHAVLVTAARRAARTWQFEPEQIEGRPVQGRVIVPVQFCLEHLGNDCRATRIDTVGGVPVRNDGGAVPLDSVVKLGSDVEGRLLGGP